MASPTWQASLPKRSFHRALPNVPTAQALLAYLCAFAMTSSILIFLASRANRSNRSKISCIFPHIRCDLIFFAKIYEFAEVTGR